MKKEIKVNENKYESLEDLIECFDDDICGVMNKYIKEGFVSKNKELFFDDKEIVEKFNYYLNGLTGLILDTHKVKFEHITKIGGNGEEYQSIEIIEDDEIKLAEDNAKADLEAQDYDVFGENKI